MTCDVVPARMAKARPARAFGLAIGLLAFANFVIVTSEFIVVGLLPAMASDLGVSLAEAGRLVTWFALAAAIAGPPATMLAARSEPKLIVMLTALVIAAGNLAVVLAPRYEALVVVRIAQGCALTVFVSVSTVAAGFLAHLLLSSVLFTAMFAGYTFIAPLLGTVAGVSGTAVGWMLAGFGLAGILGNWAAGHAADRDPLVATVAVAFALAVAMAAVGLATNAPVLLMIIIGLWGAAHMAAFVVSQVRVMQAGRGAPALAMSLNISVCNFGIALGAVFGGWIADGRGVENVGYGGGAAATVAILIASAMVAARASTKSKPRSA